jgi:hypothetical protein
MLSLGTPSSEATAVLLRPMLGELVFVGGATPNTLPLANAFARSDSPKTSVKARPFAGGFIRERSWTSCPWMRGFWDSLIAGIASAMDAATLHQLFRNLEIRVVTAPHFLATKSEAFKGRGRGDFLASHDLEDLIFVMDGRSIIVDEVQTETPLLREYLREEITGLLATPGFIDALPGYLLPDAASQGRIGTVLRPLKAVASP